MPTRMIDRLMDNLGINLEAATDLDAAKLERIRIINLLVKINWPNSHLCEKYRRTWLENVLNPKNTENVHKKLTK